MPSFTPKTEAELNPLLPKGEYDFEVIKAEDTTTKKTGDGMIALSLRVWGPDGGTCLVNDWLVFSEKCLYKVLHFCEATGLVDKYNLGELFAEDCLAKSGKAKIKIQNNEQYGEQNSVQDYVVPKIENRNVKEAPLLKNEKKTTKLMVDPNAALQEAATPSDIDVPF